MWLLAGMTCVNSCSPTQGGLVAKGLLFGEPCGPPCWQGLVPGTSTQEDVLEFMTSSYYVGDHYRDEYAGRTVIRWQSTQSGRSNQTWNAFSFKDDVLIVIRTYLDYDFTLEQLLQGYGPPEKFRANWEGGSSVIADVTLFYPQLGIAPQLELRPSDAGGYELRSETKVIRAWYFAPTSLDGLFDLAGAVPFPDKREDAEIVLQDWQGYGFIELIP